MANDLLLTGRVIGGEEALRIGLVSRVADDVMAEALAAADVMCRYSPYGLAMTKDVLWADLEIASMAAAIELEDRNQLMLGFTENLPEAIRAFDAGPPARLHRRAPPRHVLTFAVRWMRSRPLEHGEAPEPGGVEQRRRLGQAAADPQRGQVPGRWRRSAAFASATSSSMPWRGASRPARASTTAVGPTPAGRRTPRR